MTEDLDRQIRAWVEDIDAPIPVEDIRLQHRVSTVAKKRASLVVAAAAFLVLIGGIVAVLAEPNGSSSDLETAADPARNPTSTVPATRSAPTTEPADEATTTTSAVPTSPSTEPAATTRKGNAPEVVDVPAAQDCTQLRSQTVWASTGTANEISAAAGTHADYIETVTNEGPETCTMVFLQCPGPGVIHAEDGTPAPAPLQVCPAIAPAPEDLPPGASRQETFTVELFTAPGNYELRLEQLDGRLARLPIRLEPQIPACGPGTLTLDQQPYEAGTPRDETAPAQLMFSGPQSCTIRIAETRLTLHPEGEPAAAEHTFVDRARRWYDTGPGSVIADVVFGPIDLPPGQYGGTITVELDNGETLHKPARLLVW